MKNITKNILAAFSSLAMLVSCNLELEPPTYIVYDENEPLFQSEDDIESFYYGVLASYRSLAESSDMTIDVMVNYFNATTGFGNNLGGVHRLDNSYTPSDEYVESIWASHYAAIKNYNIAIEQVDYITDSTLFESGAYLQAVARYCRASAYLSLTRLFGEVYDPETSTTDLSVPLVLKYDQDYVPKRATVQQVYDQIFWDLEDAEMILKNEPGEVGAMTPTVDAIHALKARYYLDIQEYDDAYDMAKSVINSGAEYALAASKAEMEYEYNGDNGTECIMQMYASIAEGTISKSIYTSVGNDDLEGKYFAPLFLPSRVLIDAYEPNDYRFGTWFTNIGYPVFINGDYYEDVYVFIKYIGNSALYTGPIEISAHAAKPLMISEMFLIAAEAAYMDGDLPHATQYLQRLQKARNATPTEGTMENIKKEWYKEMVGRGQYFLCLKRWKEGIPERPAQTEATNLVMQGEAYVDRTIDAESYVFNLPIPAREIQITPSLIQNEGYSAK